MYACRPCDAIEVESVAALLDHVADHGTLENVVVQGLDLTDDTVEARLLDVSAEDAVFLGCRFTDALEGHIHQTGGTVFPAFEGLPFHPYRASLYTPDELMRGYERGQSASLEDIHDADIYRYYKQQQLDGGPDVPVMDALAFRIHDHAIDDALRDLLHPDGRPSRRVVGIMGGHRMARTAPAFTAIARIAHALTRNGFFVATGGGPGAMEAANLGAYLAGRDADTITAAVQMLSDAPQYDTDGYFERAYAVRERYGDGHESLAVPTWFYGHEPSNLFATHVAKYFANSIREDGLLAMAHYGVIYAPGSAGTIQEVFMDAAQNHYETFGPPSPMVFYDATYWTETKPVFPLLQALAADTPYAEELMITDDVSSVVDAITHHASARSHTA
ncbi:LOG family protein [Salisaeta longa]|uniref:LOG family protein n=1 Tax=Salisaeta longa TaxID=503170 RepID=UPI0003B37F01|nr:hypothetical protein [Salisaeta longa]